MKNSPLVEFLLDQLRYLTDVRAQRMFGGFGLYSGDVFFGIIHDERIYFKVNDANQQDYVDAGMTPFKPYKDRAMTMKYYQVPVGVLEDSEQLCHWARKALNAARPLRDFQVPPA